MYLKILVIIAIMLSLIFGIGIIVKDEDKKILNEKLQEKSQNIIKFDNNLDELLKEKNVILFFSSPICSTCKTLKNDITKNIDIIPDDLYIVDVDFEEETEIKKTYGVNILHTLVYIDKEKNEVGRKVGITKIKSLIDYYNELINDGKINKKEIIEEIKMREE